jgi:hypothetical protein
MQVARRCPERRHIWRIRWEVATYHGSSSSVATAQGASNGHLRLETGQNAAAFRALRVGRSARRQTFLATGTTLPAGPKLNSRRDACMILGAADGESTSSLVAGPPSGAPGATVATESARSLALANHAGLPVGYQPIIRFSHAALNAHTLASLRSMARFPCAFPVMCGTLAAVSRS